MEAKEKKKNTETTEEQRDRHRGENQALRAFVLLGDSSVFLCGLCVSLADRETRVGGGFASRGRATRGYSDRVGIVT
jgi:hypothetical protein